MKAVIQRVLSSSASTVDGELISSIGRGLCILIGISRNDTKNDLDYMVRKILNLRLFEDEEGKRWNKNIRDVNYEILCLSQITLYHKLKGNKLDFHEAMAPELSMQFYQEFVTALREQYKEDKIKEGRFGCHLVIDIKNDGPVTVVLESPETKQ